MSKRFIDTNLFSDDWFSELSIEQKLAFIYLICNCDHAGIYKLNRKLAEFQTGLSQFESILGTMCEYVVKIDSYVYFMPKFLKFQYPDFPKSGVKQQDSAVKLLKRNKISIDILKSYLTLSQEFINSYDNDNDNDNEYKGSAEGKIKNPTIEEMIKYFVENGFSAFSAETAWYHYNNKNWHDSQNKPVLNWKNKVKNNWFKVENRIAPTPKQIAR
jgi:hypothetical protein